MMKFLKLYRTANKLKFLAEQAEKDYLAEQEPERKFLLTAKYYAVLKAHFRTEHKLTMRPEYIRMLHQADAMHASVINRYKALLKTKRS